MIIDRDTPKAGEVYRHFKGYHYKIITVGHHSETIGKYKEAYKLLTGKDFE